jgi:hypothetical protein
MATSILEQIAQNVVATLKGVRRNAGYCVDLHVSRARKPQNVVEGTCFVAQDDPSRGESEATQSAEWMQPFRIAAITEISDADDVTSVDARLNEYRAAIEKVMLIDHTRGGNAIDTLIDSVEYLRGDEGFDAIIVTAIVHYRVKYEDPYTRI